jgi:hypothetical protein
MLRLNAYKPAEKPTHFLNPGLVNVFWDMPEVQPHMGKLVIRVDASPPFADLCEDASGNKIPWGQIFGGWSVALHKGFFILVP